MSASSQRYTSIRASELERLRRQESRLRSIQQDLPQRLNEIREESRRSLQQRLNPLQKTIQQQQQQAQKLKSELADLEKDTAQRLAQQERQFRQTIQASEARQKQALQRESSRLQSAMERGLSEQREEYLRRAREQRQEYTELIREQNEHFTQLAARERRERELGQQKLAREIKNLRDDIREERERKAKLAADFLADVDAVSTQIDTGYQHERFAPGRLEALQQELSMARHNLQAGLNEAAIANSQQVYLKLADLRLELTRKEQEWQLLYNAALTDIGTLIAEVRAHRECEVEVGEGNEVEKFTLEVDYWVKGELTEYERELAGLESQLQEGEKTLTTDQLKEIGRKIEARQPQLGEIVERAKLNILSSQMRAEIADKVVEALESLGYDLVNEADAVYEEDDMRNAYVVKVKNIAGDEVVTVIGPEKDFGVNSVSIDVFSETLVDRETARQNATAVFQVLDEEGIESRGELKCTDRPREEYRDLERVKQRRTASSQLQSAKISS